MPSPVPCAHAPSPYVVAPRPRPTTSPASPSRLAPLLHARARGLAALVAACPGLADLDLSNGVDLGDAAAAELVRARGLQRLCLSRCKPMTDMGLGCIAVGCPDLRELTLNWCLGITDLGVQLLALKCKKLRTLNLSYTMVSRASS